jgi:prepilin-type N-terminal cleavage/methylation domain-containing protein
MNKLVKKEKGFTIIEVVLVLAIAGLIFMVVFLAVPGLQRSQRDTQRRQDVGRLISTITSITSNSRGDLPDALLDYQQDGRVIDELQSGGSRFNDPSTQTLYRVTDIFAAGDTGYGNNDLTATGDFAIAINAVCGDSATAPFDTAQGNNNASFAVGMVTEGGYYCQQG